MQALSSSAPPLMPLWHCGNLVSGCLQLSAGGLHIDRTSGWHPALCPSAEALQHAVGSTPSAQAPTLAGTHLSALWLAASAHPLEPRRTVACAASAALACVQWVLTRSRLQPGQQQRRRRLLLRKLWRTLRLHRLQMSVAMLQSPVGTCA